MVYLRDQVRQVSKRGVLHADINSVDHITYAERSTFHVVQP